MKKVKTFIIGLALLSLPVATYFYPQYLPLKPVATTVLEYIMGSDNATD